MIPLNQIHRIEDFLLLVGIAALIEVVMKLLCQLLRGEALRLVKAVRRDLLPVVPPLNRRVEVLQLHGLSLGEMLVAFRHVQPVEPRLLRRTGAVEEQDVGGNGGVRRKDTARHADDRVQVELAEQLLFDVHLRIVRAEQEAVGQDDRRAPAGSQPVHDDGHEQIRRLAAGEVIREMVLHILLLAAAVGRVHQDHVKLILLRVVQHVVQQGVVVEHLRHVEIVQQQIGDAEHVGGTASSQCRRWNPRISSHPPCS